MTSSRSPAGEKAPFTRAAALGVLCVAGLVAVPGALGTSSSAQQAQEWVLTATELNPFKKQLPPEATGGAASPTHIDWGTTRAPQAEFDIDFNTPPAKVKPGGKITFNVTVQGKLVGERDKIGGRRAEPILLVNDRWGGTSIAKADVGCGYAPGGVKIDCTESGSGKGSTTATAPASGEKFSVGIGVLNCGPCYVRFTYTSKNAGAVPPPTKPPPTKPPPQPAPSQSSSGNLNLVYTMPTRFGRLGARGIVEYQDGEEEIHPDEWRVDFTVRRKDGRRCTSRDKLGIKAPEAIRFRIDGTCRFRVIYKREGTYSIDVTLKTADGKELSGRRTFPVQDWLIVGLGDSNGSGEGVPEIPRRGARPPVWQSTQCHRSANSYQAQTAQEIEVRDRRTSVTFVHLACSGAKITTGLLGAYEGIEPGRNLPLRPQIAEMRSLVGKREVDAVLISIGVNDLGFGPLVNHCLDHEPCASTPFPDARSKQTLDQVIQEKLAALRVSDEKPGLYDRLARSLSRLGIDGPRVFITEYFDSTKDENGDYCDPLIHVPWKGTFSQAEAKWVYKRVLRPLNAAVREAAKKYQWRLVSGAERWFRPHGYCSKDSWIVKLSESILGQLNKEGTLHSKTKGNRFQAGLVVTAMRPSLYPGGKPRSPAPG